MSCLRKETMKLEPDSCVPRCPNCYKALDLAHLPDGYGDGQEEHELCDECWIEEYGDD